MRNLKDYIQKLKITCKHIWFLPRFWFWCRWQRIRANCLTASKSVEFSYVVTLWILLLFLYTMGGMCRTTVRSKMELFVTKANNWKPWNFVTESIILNFVVILNTLLTAVEILACCCICVNIACSLVLYLKILNVLYFPNENWS